MGDRKAGQLKRAYIWNTLGSMMNALSSALLLLVVARLMGPYYAGVFSLAYAVGQQFQVIGAFEVRPIQATDIKSSYSFGAYLGARIVTCLVMVVALALYAIVSNGISEAAVMLFAVSGLKLFDAAEDVFHGMFQQRGRLDIAGRAFFFRSLVTFLSFSIGCVATGSLLFACAIAWISSALVFACLNVLPARDFGSLVPTFAVRKIFGLLATCFPLFVGVFLLNDLVNVPRYSIESYLTKDAQAIYAILFMPALVINLLAGFIFKPLLTPLAEAWLEGDRSRFFGTILKGCALVVVATAVVCLIAYPLGLPILSWLYGIDLSDYLGEMMLLLLGGAFNALSVVLYYGLVTMRLQYLVTVGYAVSDFAARALALFFVGGWGVMGAVELYDISMGLVFFFFAFFVVLQLFRHRKKDTPLASEK